MGDPIAPDSYRDGWKFAVVRASKNSGPVNAGKQTTNYVKQWTDEEEDMLEELYTAGTSTKEIVHQLGRGEMVSV